MGRQIVHRLLVSFPALLGVLFLCFCLLQVVPADPAMIIAVPTAQFRSSYLFYAQTGWQANYVDIIAPDGSATTVDGAPVNNFKTIGNTGYSLAHVKLSNAGDGSHNVMSDKKVGITVYGVVNYGSYWYPGGLDLDVIPQ